MSPETFVLALLSSQPPAQPQSPVIVKIIEPPPETLSDIALRALGLTGVLVLVALLLGMLLAAFMFWIRSRS